MFKKIAFDIKSIQGVRIIDYLEKLYWYNQKIP